MKRFLLVIGALLLALGSVVAGEVFNNVRWLELTEIESAALKEDTGKLYSAEPSITPFNTGFPKLPVRYEVLGDRVDYLADDPVGQFLVCMVGSHTGGPAARLVVTLTEEASGAQRSSNPVAEKTVTPLTGAKLTALLDLTALPPGAYRLAARLEGVPQAPVIRSWDFRKSGVRRTPLAFPAAGVPLVMPGQDAVADAAWPVITGVPFPRHAVNATERLMLLENGKPVPAQFTTRASWYPDGRELKWAGLSFIARYDQGKPRNYVVNLAPGNEAIPAAPATGLMLEQTADRYTINTGVIRFSVNRRSFTGLEEVCLVGADGKPCLPIMKGVGGPFLKDERLFAYTGALDQGVRVEVEEAGPVRVTLLATGWHRNDRDEACCLFQTRMTAWAGLGRVDIKHRVVLTFDTDCKRLRELGFALPLANASGWQVGADGKVFSGVLPQKESVWLHQDRPDRFRLCQGTGTNIAAGSRSDGWLSAQTPGGSVLLLVRNFWQLFPKELELSSSQLSVHLWPRHGHRAYSEAEELDFRSLYKLRYAHQGAYLDLQFPQSYFDAFPAMIKAMPATPLREGRLHEQQDINAISGNAQGAAASLDFSLVFSPAEPVAPLGQAQLFQQRPHAITDPVYNGLTEVEGRFAGRKPGQFEGAEKMLDSGYHGYTMTPDLLEDYGMWIWPDLHNNWSLSQRWPQTHRWWYNSHYQGVWEGTFLYWRSGIPWIARWAEDNYEHFANISTINYDDPRHPLQGHRKGANYHVKGFTPWGSPREGERTTDDYIEVGGHFINPDAHIIRYLLVGDPRARDLAQAWFRSFERAALPAERSREACTTLGEMLSYYTLSWDPLAIQYIHDLADDMHSRPWSEIPSHPGHTMFHNQWARRYWELTRDPRLLERLKEWFPVAAMGRGFKSEYSQIRALLWRETGDTNYLANILPQLAGLDRVIYDNPDDPSLNGFVTGRGFFFPAPSGGQTLPYFMQAVLDAKLDVPALTMPAAVPIAKTLRPEKGAPASEWFVQTASSKNSAARTGYLIPEGGLPTIELEFSGYSELRKVVSAVDPEVCWIVIEDAAGKVVCDTTVLNLSKRPRVTILLDARQQPAPWKITCGRHGLLRWTGGAEKLLLTPDFRVKK